MCSVVCPKKKKNGKKCKKTRKRCKVTCGLCPTQLPVINVETFQTAANSACGCTSWVNFGAASVYSHVCVKTQQDGFGATKKFLKVCYGYP